LLVDKKHPVLFAGENHMITLFRPGSDAIAISLSCWRCTYSEHGEGWVLVVWNDADASGLGALPPRAIYADNAALGRFVVARFNQYFDGFRDQGYADLDPQPARFSQQGEGSLRHRITCVTDAVTIALAWQEMLDGGLEIFYNTSGPIPYDVSAVICHCAHGSIAVNGQLAAGEVKRIAGETYSSAFLAFSETWAAAAAAAAAKPR
jgi:hypothetical protein